MHNCEQKTRDWNLGKKSDNFNQVLDNWSKSAIKQSASPPLSLIIVGTVVLEGEERDGRGRGGDLILLRHLKMLEYHLLQSNQTTISQQPDCIRYAELVQLINFYKVISPGILHTKYILVKFKVIIFIDYNMVYKVIMIIVYIIQQCNYNMIRFIWRINWRKRKFQPSTSRRVGMTILGPSELCRTKTLVLRCYSYLAHYSLLRFVFFLQIIQIIRQINSQIDLAPEDYKVNHPEDFFFPNWNFVCTLSLVMF